MAIRVKQHFNQNTTSIQKANQTIAPSINSSYIKPQVEMQLGPMRIRRASVGQKEKHVRNQSQQISSGHNINNSVNQQNYKLPPIATSNRDTSLIKSTKNLYRSINVSPVESVEQQSLSFNNYHQYSQRSSPKTYWKGKSDRFTGGFMMQMYQNNTLMAATRDREFKFNKLVKLKNIEELARKQEEELRGKREFVQNFYEMYQVEVGDQTVKALPLVQLEMTLYKKLFQQKEQRAALTIQKAYHSHRQLLNNEQVEVQSSINSHNKLRYQAFKRNRAAKVIQRQWKEHLNSKQFRSVWMKQMEKAAVVMQKNFKGYMIRKQYVPIMKKNKLDKNFLFFDEMRREVVSNALIKIKYSWKKYVKVKQLQRKKTQKRRPQQSGIKAKVDSNVKTSLVRGLRAKLVASPDQESTPKSPDTAYAKSGKVELSSFDLTSKLQQSAQPQLLGLQQDKQGASNKDLKKRQVSQSTTAVISSQKRNGNLKVSTSPPKRLNNIKANNSQLQLKIKDQNNIGVKDDQDQQAQKHNEQSTTNENKTNEDRNMLQQEENKNEQSLSLQKSQDAQELQQHDSQEQEVEQKEEVELSQETDNQNEIQEPEDQKQDEYQRDQMSSPDSPGRKVKEMEKFIEKQLEDMELAPEEQKLLVLERIYEAIGEGTDGEDEPTQKTEVKDGIQEKEEDENDNDKHYEHKENDDEYGFREDEGNENNDEEYQNEDNEEQNEDNGLHHQHSRNSVSQQSGNFNIGELSNEELIKQDSEKE